MALVNRILVPIDFSECSTRALEYAAELSSRLGAPLRLLHVYVTPVVYLPAEVWTIASSLDEVRDELMKALEQRAATARELGAKDVSVAFVEGAAPQEIVRIATAQRCDLIVMGTHGRGGLKHLLLGSVAEKVVRRADCPVLTVGPKAELPPA